MELEKECLEAINSLYYDGFYKTETYSGVDTNEVSCVYCIVLCDGYVHRNSVRSTQTGCNLCKSILSRTNEVSSQLLLYT
jgi:hypothetical protein